MKRARITLRTVIEHMQNGLAGLQNDMQRGFERQRKDMHGELKGLRSDLGGRIDRLEQKVDRHYTNLTGQISTIDGRLDDIEIGMKEQKHERRITRLEQRVAL